MSSSRQCSIPCGATHHAHYTRFQFHRRRIDLVLCVGQGERSGRFQEGFRPGRSPNLVHTRQPQALLRAVIVLNIKLSEDNRWQTDVLRTNSTQPEMLQRAIETVERARVELVPDDVRDELVRNGITETWLFDKDGSFQVKTLAKAQRYNGS